MGTIEEMILSDLQACLEVKWYRGRCALVCVKFEPPSQRYETIIWAVKRGQPYVIRTHYDDYDHCRSTKTTTYDSKMSWKQLKALIVATQG